MNLFFFFFVLLSWKSVICSAEYVFPMDLLSTIPSAIDTLFLYCDTNRCGCMGQIMEKFADKTPDVKYKFFMIKEEHLLTINGHASVQDFFSQDDIYVKEPISLREITYFCRSDTFHLETTIYGTQKMSPYPEFSPERSDVWEFKMMNTTLFVSRVSRRFNVTLFGSFELPGNNFVDTVLTRRMNEEGYLDDYTISGSGPVNDLNGPEMVRTFTGKDLNPDVGIHDDPITAVSISGFRKSDDMFTWFSIKMFGENGRIAVFLHHVYPFDSDDHKITGYAYEYYGDVRFSNFYSDVDISSVPYFGSANAKDVSYVELSRDEEFCSIPPGMLDDVLLFPPKCIQKKNAKASFNFSAIPFTFQGDQEPNKLHAVPENNAHTLRQALRTHAPEIDLDEMNHDRKFFFDVRTVYNVGLEKITLPLGGASIGDGEDEDHIACYDMMDGKNMSFFYNYLVITNADVTVCLTKDHSLDVTVKGQMSIGDVNFNVTIEKNGKDYTIKAEADEIGVSTILSHFHAQFFPPELGEAFQSNHMLSMGVKDAFILYKFTLNSSNHLLEIGGKPTIFGNTSAVVEIDALVAHHDTTNDLAAGIFIENVPLDMLILETAMLRLSGVKLLDVVVNASVYISPSAEEEYEIHGEKVHKGLSLEATMGFPKDCSDNFCKGLRNLVGADTLFGFTGTIKSATKFNFFAGIENVSLSNGFVLKEAGLELRVDALSTEVGVTATVHFPNPPLDLTFEFDADIGGGQEFRFSMEGCYNDAFNMSWLSFCDIAFSVKIDPDTLELPSGFSFAGEVYLGDRSCSTPFVAKGAVLFDANNDVNNYYYVSFTKATFQSFLNAFCWHVKLPQVLGETGFPDGFTSSYAEKEQQILDGTVTIPRGFFYKGTLDILGLKASAEIKVDFDSGNENLNMSVELPPLGIAGGILEMYRSSDDHAHGPILNASIALKPFNINVYAKGFVDVLGVSVEATLLITDEMFQYSFAAKLFNLFQADFEISASYTSQLSDASFEIKGKFNNDLFEAIENFLKNVVGKAIHDAETKIKEAEQDLEAKKKDLENAKATLESDKCKVDNAYGAFRSAEASIESAEQKLQAALNRCPSWIRWACKGVLWIAQKAMDAAEWTVQESSHALDLAKDALTACEGMIDVAEGAITAAEDFLEGVREACEIAMKAADIIANFVGGLENIIDIKEVSFDAKLSDAHIGAFGVSMIVEIVGKTYNLDLYLDLNDIGSICKQLAVYIGEGIEKLF